MYQAYNLSTESRNLLLTQFPPIFDNVVMHHITYKFGVPKNAPLPPEVENAQVIGYMKNDDIECLICVVNGESNRPSGGTYHITISHSSNASPKDSNDLIENGEMIEVSPINITLIPALNP